MVVHSDIEQREVPYALCLGCEVLVADYNVHLRVELYRFRECLGLGYVDVCRGEPLPVQVVFLNDVSIDEGDTSALQSVGEGACDPPPDSAAANDNNISVLHFSFISFSSDSIRLIAFSNSGLMGETFRSGNNSRARETAAIDGDGGSGFLYSGFNFRSDRK